MKKNRFLLSMFMILNLWACKKEDSATLGEYKPKFVVEGWIESDNYPYVILTHNVPFFATLDSAQLDQLVIRWAKVTVSDGQTSEVLTAKRDNNYFPPFIYRGSTLLGVPGKTYTLTIEYAGYTLTSTTTIPAKAVLDSIWFHDKEGGNKAQLNIRLKDNQDEKNYYKLFTKTENEKRFIPTLVSNHDDKHFNGKVFSLQVNRGPVNNLTIKNDPYFTKGETVFVKIASIDQKSFTFWNTFQDEVLNSSNPLIGSTGKISSNIQGPALGIWCGYGSTIYRVTANP